ncbi:hypothetical protein BJX68DRAFT_269449 [Aspergillus pseudodeflectus]|uniref:Mid2 domain-containing protein n=1 Tax=Aspergillus pseudodeflectus TaxID=176178 RepID=A0ABR4JXZ2_9EURO
MLAFLVDIFWTLALVRAAFEDDFEIVSPTPGQNFSADSGAMPLISANATATMNIQVYTTHVVTGDVYSDGTGVYSILVTEATSTTSTPTTVDHTVTETPTPNPTSTSSDSEPTGTPLYYPPMIREGIGGDDEDYMQDDGGLSSGAKAGIGAGVAVGTVLLVVGAILLHRRHMRRNPPKTIREITSGPSQTEL